MPDVMFFLFRTVQDVQAAVERSGGGGRAWYLKDPHMQRGQGVVVFVYGEGDRWAEVWSCSNPCM